LRFHLEALLDESAYTLNHFRGIPVSRINHVRENGEDRDARTLERALNEAVAHCGWFCAQRRKYQRPVDVMPFRLVHNPLVRPRREMKLFVHADGAAGEG
jgi:hypothetical protein